jgi:hypothetical protein
MNPLRRRRPPATAPPVTVTPGGPTAVPIESAPERVPTCVSGQVTLIRSRPSTGLPSLAVTIADGSGSVDAVWSGRRALGGVHLGGDIAVEGVAVREGRRLVFRNPKYTLLPPGSAG